MFHYWYPKGAGALGVSCLLIGGIIQHQRNKDIDRRLADARKRGVGMWTIDKNGNRKFISI